MTLVTRSATASIDASTAMFAPQLTGLVAGEALDLCSACFIHTDGKVYMANATAANAEAVIAGFTARAVSSGEPVTLLGEGTRLKYGSGLTPGAILYLAATDGKLDTAATTGDAVGVARAVTATDIVILRTRPELAASTAINGGNLATVANANVVGGVPVIFRINIAAGALGNTDVVVTNKIRVIDAWLVLTGAGVSTTTLQVKNGSTAITDAMAASGSDKAIVRAAQIDDAAHEIAAGGTLRVTSATGATQPDAIVYVLAIPVA